MYGQYERTLDDKNRVVIPTKIRDYLTSKVYLTIGLEGNLELRSETEWNKFAQELQSKNQFDRKVRTFSRAMFARTIEIDIDKQSRINIPSKFLELTSVKKNLVFVGMGNKVEIWDNEEFNIFSDENSSAKLEALAQEISDKGF